MCLETTVYCTGTFNTVFSLKKSHVYGIIKKELVATPSYWSILHLFANSKLALLYEFTSQRSASRKKSIWELLNSAGVKKLTSRAAEALLLSARVCFLRGALMVSLGLW
jgi:hypothetical protein